MIDRASRFSLVRCVVLSTVLGAPAIPAQQPETEEAAAPDERPVVQDEIVVTARKREEDPQDVPVSISAWTGEALSQRQIVSSDLLSNVAPNLSFDGAAPGSGSRAVGQAFIRGIGQVDYAQVLDPGVALYLDGVYLARTVGSVFDLLDVERVEVLRGPQGTLFGRNAIGGAISIHSRRPDGNRSASLVARVGSDDLLGVAARANLPLSERLFANVAVARTLRDGYVERPRDGIRTGDENSLSGRAALRYLPSERFEWNLAIDRSRSRDHGAPSVSGGVDDTQAFAAFGNAMLGSCGRFRINPNFPAAGPPTFPPPGSAGVGGDAGCYGPDNVAGPYISEGTYPVFSHLDAGGASSEVRWELSDATTLVAVTGFRDFLFNSSRDADNTPANLLQTRIFYDHRQFSQELQLRHDADGPLSLVGGVYGFDESGVLSNYVTLPVGVLRSYGAYDNRSTAAFVQASFALPAGVEITVGGRYTRDTKGFEPRTYAAGDASFGNDIFGPTWPLLAGSYLSAIGPLRPGEFFLERRRNEKEFDAVTGAISLSRSIADRHLLYASFSQGFKSGGFNGRLAAPPVDAEGRRVLDPKPFRSEFADAYEVGFKSEWLDRRLTLNASLFHTDYQGLHITIRETFNPLIFNGGSADIEGGEIEMSWLGPDSWRLDLGVGLIDARYARLSEEVLTNATPILPHYRLVGTPEATSSLGLSRSLDLGAAGELTARVDWSYRGREYNDAANTPQLASEPYHLVAASLSFRLPEGRWTAILAGRNLLDETFLVSGNSAFGTAAAYVEQTWGRPRSWSLSLRRDFF